MVKWNLSKSNVTTFNYWMDIKAYKDYCCGMKNEYFKIFWDNELLRAQSEEGYLL